jgi:hypothetical protein
MLGLHGFFGLFLRVGQKVADIGGVGLGYQKKKKP